MIVLRFILRFLLVPFGGLAAAAAATFVVCFAHWSEFARMIAADPKAPESFVLAVIYVGPAVVLIMSVGALAMLMPALLGVAISEIFALRSLLYHVTNGAVASAVGWKALEGFLKSSEFFSDPKIVMTAGITAGFAYWAVAGWSAGFWKPVFSSPPPPPTVAPA
jgi:hypothetical protein